MCSILFVVGIYVATNKMHNATVSYCLYHKSIKDEQCMLYPQCPFMIGLLYNHCLCIRMYIVKVNVKIGLHLLTVC